MRIDTENEKAQTLVAGAAQEIQRYRQERILSKLKSARAILEEARREDPEYLSAIYFSALVDDLLGKSSAAIPQLEDVLAAKPPFLEEVRFHLGVAYYHRYNSENLDKAIACFKQVLEASSNFVLQASAHAAMGQAYAMKLMPATPASAELGAMEILLHSAVREATQALKNAEKGERENPGLPLDEVRWMAHNAQGMAVMYFSDYAGAGRAKIEQLKMAVSHFRRANDYKPRDWANYCDLASAHMRLGYWSSDLSEFRIAEGLLNTVVESLRPGYGFAIYELGRVCRLQKIFHKALSLYDQALSIPYEFREVSDRRLNIERQRAKNADPVFP
jgi:tetratricopeptide (TPR) repeat protein